MNPRRIPRLSSFLMLSMMSFAVLAMSCDRGASPRLSAGEMPIPTDVQEVVKAFRKLVDVTEGDNRLLIYCYGDRLKLVGLKQVRGNGLALSVINRKAGKSVVGYGCSEADYEVVIDFSELGDGIVRVTDLTWDPRHPDGRDTPFILTTYTIDDEGRCTESEELLLKAEPGGPAEVERWTKAGLDAVKGLVAEHHASDEGKYTEALGHLRNIAVNRPDEVLTVLAAFRGNIDGHLRCIMNDFQWEVEKLKEIRKRERF